jgi:hypothetical protein
LILCEKIANYDMEGKGTEEKLKKAEILLRRVNSRKK